MPPAFCMFLNPTSSCRQPKLSQMLYCLRFTPILAIRWSHHCSFGHGSQRHLGCTTRRAHWSQAWHDRSQHTGVSYPQMSPFTFTCRSYPMLSPKAQQLTHFRAHRKQTDGQQEYDTWLYLCIKVCIFESMCKPPWSEYTEFHHFFLGSGKLFSAWT